MDIALVSLFGLVAGSFLNVCIYRVPLGKSIVLPRSACPACGHAIACYDNVPLLSFLVLGGRCRHCSAPISWQYPGWRPSTPPLGGGVLAFGLPVLRPLCGLHQCHDHPLLHRRPAPDPPPRHHLQRPGAGACHRPLAGPSPGHAPTSCCSLLSWPGIPSQPLWAGWFSALLGLLTGAGILLLVAVGYYLVEGRGHGPRRYHHDGLRRRGPGLARDAADHLPGLLPGRGGGPILIRRSGGDRKYEIPFGTFLALASVIALLGR